MSSIAVAAPSSLVLMAALTVALSPTLSRARPAAPRPDAAAISGLLDVSITGPALKHWGIAGATAVFVPDTDRSAFARRIRNASGPDALCAALTAAEGRDAAIRSARADGDGDLEHRAGEQMQLAFRIDVSRLAAALRGVVYVCSSPILAVLGRGEYPYERFESVADQRFRWMSAPLTLHPGEAAHVAGTASIDASQW